MWRKMWLRGNAGLFGLATVRVQKKIQQLPMTEMVELVEESVVCTDFSSIKSRICLGIFVTNEEHWRLLFKELVRCRQPVKEFGNIVVVIEVSPNPQVPQIRDSRRASLCRAHPARLLPRTLSGPCSWDAPPQHHQVVKVPRLRSIHSALSHLQTSC